MPVENRKKKVKIVLVQASGNVALSFFDSVLDKSKWLASSSDRFTTEKLQYPLDRRFDVSQSWSGHCGAKKIVNLAVQLVARRCTDWVTSELHVKITTFII
jgi:hypothetical protein